MMRKYFPLEASEHLFVAIEEDDVVDAQVSLPPTIALRKVRISRSFLPKLTR